MKGLGTVINVACILLGGICGLLFGKKIGASVRESLMKITGVAVMFLAAGGAMEKMLSVGADGALISDGTLMMIISLASGTVLGELCGIDAGVERFGEFLKAKSHSHGDGGFISAFVSASCTVCIGAMAVVGSIRDGVSGDYSILLSKGVLDAIIICIMTASKGKGCIFSALPVGIFQGLITLAAVFAGSFMTAAALDCLSLVGSVLIFCVGLNLVFDMRLRVANMLPSLIVASVWGFLL